MQISLDLAGKVEKHEAIVFLKSALDGLIQGVSCPIHHRPPGEMAGELVGLRYAWRFRGVCCEALVAEIKSIFAQVEESARKTIE